MLRTRVSLLSWSTWDCCNLRVRNHCRCLSETDTLFLFYLLPILSLRRDGIGCWPCGYRFFQIPIHVVACSSGIFHPMKGTTAVVHTIKINIRHRSHSLRGSVKHPAFLFHHTLLQLNPGLCRFFVLHFLHNTPSVVAFQLHHPLGRRVEYLPLPSFP